MKTYLAQSFKNGRLMRWQGMPLTVYIAPMKFYTKAGEDYKYRQMVREAFEEWRRAADNKLSFVFVEALLQSQINVDWKRVERKALGHCYFSYDGQNRLYGAEVSIGLTDGRIHQDYDSDSEVYHTILHEVGHALGLGHSPNQADIMYTPHRYGITKLSDGDKLSIKWLYKLTPSCTVAEVAAAQGAQSSDIDYIISKAVSKKDGNTTIKSHYANRDLLLEQENIADLKKYNMALQNIKISDDMRKFFINPPKNK